jgi:hypothetical protein
MKVGPACVALVVTLGGCGRIGFDPLLDGDLGDTGVGVDVDVGSSSSGGSNDGSQSSDGLVSIDAPASDDTSPADVMPPVDVMSSDAAEAGPTCRAGCTCEWYFGHRYMLCPDKISYTDARNACTSFGMHLVRLTFGNEQSYLRLRSQQDAYPKFHIGASDALQEGVWLWDDGTQFWSGAAAGMAVGGNFAFWASGEPNNQGGDENCGEVQSIQGWNDSVCDFENKPFICKEYCAQNCPANVCGDGIVSAAAGEVCDDGNTGQYCTGCTQFICPAGCQCFAAAGNNYALCTTGAAFGDAAVACGKHGMALATVTSATEDMALRTQATGAGVAEYWLGGTDQDAEGNWMWMNTTRFWSGAATGMALAYAHFAPMMPGGGTARNCLHVTASGTWTDEACTSSFAYMCERFAP